MTDPALAHPLATLAAGLVAGALSGFLGVTPGGILVPCLTLIVGGRQHLAQAISLAAQLVPTSLAGLAAYRQTGHATRLNAVLPVALGFLPGAYLGARAALGLSDQVLRWAFVAYLLVLALSVALKGRTGRVDDGRPEGRAGALALVLVGMAAGASSGLLGIGGGLAMVALLSMALAFSQHQAQGVSLAVSVLPLGLPALWVYGQQGLPWSVVALVVFGLLLGTFAGARLAGRFQGAQLRRYFIGLIALMAMLMAYQALSS